MTDEQPIRPNYYRLDNGDWCLPVARRIGQPWACMFTDETIALVPDDMKDMDVIVHGAEDGDILGAIIFRINDTTGEFSQ